MAKNLLDFVPGQRWISNTEPELGLGVIQEYENRRVTILFPSVEEERVYSAGNAPLSRVQYHAGDTVYDVDNIPLQVTAVEELRGFTIYICENAEGEVVNLPETQLYSNTQLSSPKDRILAGQVDKHSRYKTRYQALSHLGTWQQSPVRGLLGGRIQLLPHQLYIANEVGQRQAPRVLLADEVGLGKTIEAGLIIHQQIETSRAERILIVVPETLIHQWLVELLRRFNLRFSIFDNSRCDALLESEPEMNPFESEQYVLCSMDTLASSDRIFQHAVEAKWDLLVVDEAHHLAWEPGNASGTYTRVEALARHSQGLLLLTATPEQLGVASHFARLRLLDPDRYHDLDAFIAEEEQYRPVNQLVQTLLGQNGLRTLQSDNTLQKKLSQHIGEARLAALLAIPEDAEHADDAIYQAVKVILDQHGTGRVLFRNTRHTISGFPERLASPAPLEAPLDFEQQLQAWQEARGDSAEGRMRGALQPERLYGMDWLECDPRVAWLRAWLKEHRREKVLVICARAETAMDLETYLNLKAGVRSAVFHEGLSILERDRAGAYFADTLEGAQVLVCSEIGSEGRNFQFAHHLVLFDLPMNPDLLEQRIGRLDRIGQADDISIHVPYYQDTAQEVLYQWYDRGLAAFSQPFIAGGQVLAKFGEQLLEVMENPDEQAREELIAATRSYRETLVKQMQEGRDPLVELNSCRHEVAEQVIAQIRQQDAEPLQDFMESVFDRYGVQHEVQSEGVYVVHPGDHMLTSHFPGLPDEGLTLTYERDIALGRDDIQYLSWEHPMVQGVLDMILGSEFGNTTLCTVKLPPLEPGTMLLEAIFVLRCRAPRRLQVERYIGGATRRVLVDRSGKDLGHIIKVEHLDGLGQKVPRRNAQELIRHARQDLESLINTAQSQAMPDQAKLVTAARERMNKALDAEIERMESLAAVNPNVKPEEVEALKARKDQLTSVLEEASLALEAIRVVVAT